MSVSENENQSQTDVRPSLEELKPSPVDGLKSLDLDGIVDYIKSGKAKNIIIMQGAGISCGAGIPDFRTPGTGLYHNLESMGLPSPESIFDINYFQEHPEPFYLFAKNMLPGQYKPTLAHHLPILFDRHEMLLRVYTQNVDELEYAAGVPYEKICHAHGSYYTGHCLDCDKKFSLDDYRESILEMDVFRCDECYGLVKPDVIFFNEQLPLDFFLQTLDDFPKCDLLIVIGTSLQVNPFAGMIGKVPEECPRILFNIEKSAYYPEIAIITKDEGDDQYKLVEVSNNQGRFKFDHQLNRRDVFVKGDCQVTIKDFIEKLGWSEELKQIMSPQKH
ncbi:NAD-dependent protein deacetylase sirtuin-2 [Tritrichomonas foetus]|uniref:NAD-dependent protein deacetylase sirtuin-2 n=1 Tax=Tritrichomonas foetus TaxID=1144522 RepID=A0A1J4KLF5_9EUKA|nr:NAD-dependent protein deacetylase sirtuin-2 [Tritrichomonas foetus]|eukprot:OHT11970.1 NAD-dependent protein deacetylase sirtuin-2 [Tritrichomonas foetus]